MTMDEVIALAKKHCGGNMQAIGNVIGAKLIADAVDRIAIEQTKIADVQTRQWEVAKNMQKMVAPMMDKMKEEMNDGESWKERTDEDDDAQ